MSFLDHRPLRGFHMRASTLVFCSLASVVAWNINQSSQAAPQPDALQIDAEVEVAEAAYENNGSSGQGAIAPPDTFSPTFSSGRKPSFNHAPSSAPKPHPEQLQFSKQWINTESYAEPPDTQPSEPVPQQGASIAETILQIESSNSESHSIQVVEPSESYSIRAFRDSANTQSIPSDWSNEVDASLAAQASEDDESEIDEDEEPVDWENLPELPPPLPEEEPADPESTMNDLGEIQVIAPPRRSPTAQLLLRSGYITTSNIADPIFTEGNSVWMNSATFLVTPELSNRTRLVARAGVDLAEVFEADDYTVARFGLGVQQRVGHTTFLQLGWTHDRTTSGNNFLSDHSARFSVLHQERLSERLRFSPFYELRASFTNPEIQSRISNSLGARLSYSVTPRFETGLDYRLVVDSLTEGGEFDGGRSTGARNQFSLVANYQVSRQFFINSSVSYLFGETFTFDQGAQDLNNVLFQIGIGLNLPLF